MNPLFTFVLGVAAGVGLLAVLAAASAAREELFTRRLNTADDEDGVAQALRLGNGGPRGAARHRKEERTP